jgi:hypothetical protein
MNLILNDALLDRMVNAVEAVKDRLKRAAAALEAGGVPYAVVGGNAVAAWVAQADPAAVRNTQDVDMLLRRADFDRAKAALESAGFVYRHVKSIDMFLDGPGTKARDAVHILYAGEKVRTDSVAASPDVSAAVPSLDGHQVIGLEPLVVMKLTSYRDKDRTHLRDLLDVELIDATWPARLPPPLGSPTLATVLQ